MSNNIPEEYREIFDPFLGDDSFRGLVNKWAAVKDLNSQGRVKEASDAMREIAEQLKDLHLDSPYSEQNLITRSLMAALLMQRDADSLTPGEFDDK